MSILKSAEKENCDPSVDAFDTPESTDPRNVSFAIRESVSRLPCQVFFTWLSGCPLQGQKPSMVRTPLMHTLDSIIGFPIAVVCTYLVLIQPAEVFWLLLPLMWLVSTGRARKMFITISHQVAHSQLLELKSRTATKRINNAIGRLISVMIFVPNPEEYHKTHTQSHHKYSDVATPKDQDGSSIFRLGFVPGKSVVEYQRLLFWTLLSPSFYLKEAYGRLLARPYATVVLSLLVLAIAAFAPRHLYALSLSYAVPVFVGFPASGLLQTLGRHFWGVRMAEVGSRRRTALVSQGRFLLDQFPSAPAPTSSLFLWWARLAFYHLPARIAVLNGDVQHHDWHHRHPRAEDWYNSVYARAEKVANPDPNWPEPYTHTWTLWESMNRTFEEMSNSPSLSDEWLSSLNEAPTEFAIN